MIVYLFDQQYSVAIQAYACVSPMSENQTISEKINKCQFERKKKNNTQRQVAFFCRRRERLLISFFSFLHLLLFHSQIELPLSMILCECLPEQTNKNDKIEIVI